MDVVFENGLETDGCCELSIVSCQKALVRKTLGDLYTEFATMVEIGPLLSQVSSSRAAERASCAAAMSGGYWYINGVSSSKEGGGRLFFV